MTSVNDSTEEAPVLWRTFSGRLHKFGPLVQPASRWASPFRRALCNASISTDERTQVDVRDVDRCKRCFPVEVQS